MTIGLKRGTVQIVPYSMVWPTEFLAEKARLEQALGNKIHGIEHIGSTSVPDLAAKPLIDMIVAVDDLGVYKELIEPLTKLGYEFMPERVFSDRVFFPKGPRAHRTHHVSLVVKDSAGWRDPILFRDYLIAHAEVRQAYQELKQTLATKYADDRPAYTAAKSAFINRILGTSAL